MDSLLNDLLKNGILDETVIRRLKAMKDQEYLNMHRYKIYQNKDGRWVTYSHLRADGLLCSRDYYYCQYRHFFYCLSHLRR